MKTLKQTIKLLAVMAIGFGLLAILFTQLNVVVKAAPADQLDVCATCIYTTIQTAVNAANPGDTIRVAAGTYTGMMSASELTATVVLTKDLVLLGGFSSDFSQRAPDTYVTTIDTEGNLWGGVLIYGSQSEVDGFHIVNAYGGGVAVANNQSVTAVGTVIHNRIAYNRIMTETQLSFGGAGINVANGAEAVIAHNEIVSNTVEREYSYGGGIQVVGSSAEIYENVIAYNLSHEEAVGGGIDLYQATAVISNNNIHHNAINGIGIYRSTAEVLSNTIDSNTAYGGGGIEISSESLFTVTNNIITNNIAQLYSGGGIAVFGQSTGVIADNEIVNNTAEAGGGIGTYDNGDLIIRHNHILSNTAVEGGGGVHINPDDFVLTGTSRLTITNNLVQGNSAKAGAGLQVMNVRTTVDISANDIRYNRIAPGEPDYAAGGIEVRDIGEQITVNNNLLVDNDNRGLKAYNFADLWVVNNTFAEGNGDSIEVFYWPASPPEPVTATLLNNIIVNQTGCGVFMFNGIDLRVDYNLFHGNAADICGDTIVPPHANIYADPLFADAVNGDFKLHSTSPAIDSGAAEPNVPNTDIEGNHRPQGGGIDMGAYEAVRYALFLPVTVKPVLVP